MSDPVARLHACRLQLKRAQSALEFERRFSTDYIGQYEKLVCRALDEVWEAQLAAYRHLACAVSPQVGVINGQRWVRV